LHQQKGQRPSSAALILPVCDFFIRRFFPAGAAFLRINTYFHHIADAYQKSRGNPVFSFNETRDIRP
jgi:hypothetical protein